MVIHGLRIKTCMFLKIKTMTILKQITNLQQPYHSKLEKMFPYLQIKRGSSNVKAIMIFHIVWLSQCNTLALVHMSFTYYMIVFTLSLRGVQHWVGRPPPRRGLCRLVAGHDLPVYVFGGERRLMFGWGVWGLMGRDEVKIVMLFFLCPFPWVILHTST